MRSLVLLTAVVVALSWAVPASAADKKENGKDMYPTVRVVSYHRTATGRIIAEGSGSGTFITRGGRILTNHHVIFDQIDQKPYDAFEIDISFDIKEEPIRKYTAQLVAHDKPLDLAILQIDPENVWGEKIPPLKHLDWDRKIKLKESQSIHIQGFPASGGRTLTQTQGQISGFDKLNEYTCFKTDTDIDHGSSGGTVLDSKGRFIGIPTFLRSYAENVGYVLDIREARPWIKEHIDKPVAFPATGHKRLIKELARYTRANDDRKLHMEALPGFQVELPESWRFEHVDDALVLISQRYVTDPARLVVLFDRRPFVLDKAFRAHLKKTQWKQRDRFPDLKFEDVKFCGVDAWRIEFTVGRSKRILHMAFAGTTLMTVVYGINEQAAEKQQKAVDALLAKLSISADTSKIPKPVREFKFASPALEIKLPEGWGGRENPGSDDRDELITFWQKDNHDATGKLFYRRTPDEQLNVPTKKRLEEEIDKSYGRSVMRKQDDLMINGLSGFLLITEHAGDTPNEKNRTLSAVLKNGKKEFVFAYTDKSEKFKENSDAIRSILTSMRFGGKSTGDPKETNIGFFRTRFADIQHHRYASAITSLGSLDLLRPWTGKEKFAPEQPVTRAVALRLVIDSWNKVQDDRKSKEQIELVAKGPDFADVPADHWVLPYARTAVAMKLLGMPGKGNFEPDKTMPLHEVLALVFKVYKIDLWQGKVSPAWKPVMDKGYEKHLINRGAEDPQHIITNAEMAYLIKRMVNMMD